MPNYQSQEPFIDAEFTDIVRPGDLVKVPDPRLFENRRAALSLRAAARHIIIYGWPPNC